jgi:hypothetical protein
MLRSIRKRMKQLIARERADNPVRTGARSSGRPAATVSFFTL